MTALVRKKHAERRKTADVYELQDLTVHEVSIVDKPAIGREFLITKSHIATNPALALEQQRARDESAASVTAALAAARTKAAQRRQADEARLEADRRKAVGVIRRGGIYGAREVSAGTQKRVGVTSPTTKARAVGSGMAGMPYTTSIAIGIWDESSFLLSLVAEGKLESALHSKLMDGWRHAGRDFAHLGPTEADDTISVAVADGTSAAELRQLGLTPREIQELRRACAEDGTGLHAWLHDQGVTDDEIRAAHVLEAQARR